MRGGWLGVARAHHSTSSSSPGASLAASDLALSDFAGPALEPGRSMILSSTPPVMRPPVDRSSCRCSKVGSSSSGVPLGGGASLPNSNDGRSESATFSSTLRASIMLLAPCASCPLPWARSLAASRVARRALRRSFALNICGDQGEIKGKSGGDQGRSGEIRGRSGKIRGGQGEIRGEIRGRSGDNGARATGGSGGEGGLGPRRGNGWLRMGGLRRGGLRGELTAANTEPSPQTARKTITTKTASKFSVRAITTTGHSVRMSSQRFGWTWRRDAGQSEEG